MHAWMHELTWNEMTRHEAEWNEWMGEWNKRKIMILLFALHMCMVFVMFLLQDWTKF